MNDMEKWIGRTTKAQQTVEQWPLTGLAALIDGRDSSLAACQNNAIHPCAHWLYFVPAVPQDQIDADGHPVRGDFIPPLPQARRMWAKSEITYHDDMLLNDVIERNSVIANLTQKTGSSGELVFLEIDHQYKKGEQLLREEKQTLVYRDHQDYDDDIFTRRVEEKADWSFAANMGPVELFRYSAVTFNGHRIHYDSDYTINVEKYPAIIVQGQLIATLLLSHALSANGVQRCKRFTFTAVKPIFSDQNFFLEGKRASDGVIEAWARSEDGRLNMRAQIEL